MTQPNLLWDKFTTFTPNFGKLEFLGQISMNLLTDTFDRATVSIVCQYDRIVPVRLHVGFFGVDSDKVKHFPDFFKQPIKVKFKVATNHNSIRLLGKHIDLF